MNLEHNSEKSWYDWVKCMLFKVQVLNPTTSFLSNIESQEM